MSPEVSHILSENDMTALRDLETCFVWMKDIPERRIEPVEVMLVLGNAAAVRTALFAAHLYEHGMAPLIVCCGGRGRTTLDKIETEAATMAMVLRSCGIPEQAILTDQSSSNTKENFVNGFALLKRHGINPRSTAIVHDSGTPRRDRNMLWRHFPEYQPSSGAKLAIHPSWGETFLEVALCGSFGSSFEPYAHMFVGTIQRVLECACPARPWHVPDEPPTDVREAYLRLRDRFTQQLEPIPTTQGPKARRPSGGNAMSTRKMKQNPVSKPPTPSQGGHRWVKGTWCSKCSYGCGAFSEENESGEPVTEPLHMCPSNPMARGRFRLISPAPKPSSPL